MNLDDTPLADILNETATLYETVAALPAVIEKVAAARPAGVPGSKLPPGANDLLDIDEHQRAITATDEWATFLARTLIDEVPRLGAIPHGTPGRLRLVARWAEHYENHPDLMLRYGIGLESREYLAELRRISKRGTRVVRTQSGCLDVACRGSYVATITGSDATGDLVCSVCGSRVPKDQWERWGARSTWVTPQRVATMLGIPVSTVRVWAHRYRWDREGQGRDVKYRTTDVQQTADGRGLERVEA